MKLVGSYVNIAEVVDIICCSLSVTRFTMVFGKFFAFLALKKQKLLHLQVFEMIEKIIDHTHKGKFSS